MQKLVLIDGHAILHRAYHALPALTTSSGQPINAIYGFLLMLLRTIADLKPTHMAITFDRPKPTFRKKLYKEYQSQRPEMEKELIDQVELIHKVIKTIGLPIYELDGFEADDIIGTISDQVYRGEIKKEIGSEDEKPEVVIVTGDRDILQLARDSVKVYMPVKGISEAKLYSKEDVFEKYGISPDQIADYKGLIGDASDNYSGVSGIGPKTAVSLLSKFGSVEKIYTNLDSLDGKVKEKLEKGKDAAYLSKKLATIVTDVPIEFDWKSSKIPSLDRPDIRAIFEELEFRSLIPRLSGQDIKETKKIDKKEAIKKDENKKVEQKTLF